MLDLLKTKVHSEPDKYKKCCLMLDAMAVKQQVAYDHHAGKMTGFVNLGDGDDATEEAKEVLVFMVVGLCGHWKVPFAYFFTKTLNSEAQHQLITHAFYYLHEAGLAVQSITMDGHACNVSMCRLFGCNFDVNQIKTSFPDPATGATVHVVFDACHMLKLVRNMLDAYGIIKSDDGLVQWSYIKDLQNLQVCEKKQIIPFLS